MINLILFSAKFLIAGIIWFYIFSFSFGDKSIFTRVKDLKNGNETVQNLENKIESRISKIKEKVGFGSKPPKSAKF